MESQLLDNMDLERERGITIKSRAVQTVLHGAGRGDSTRCNLIDTPGHVDFNYEVSRSLAACEGAVLVVDATQGVEAQTLANTYLAMEHDLEILPVFNKIDLPAADPHEGQAGGRGHHRPARDGRAGDLRQARHQHRRACWRTSCRTSPRPDGDANAPLQALVFDSQYDPYVGVVVYFRIKQGTLRKGQTIRMMATGAEYTILECGYLKPLGNEPTDALQAGEVGYFTASIKNVKDTQCRRHHHRTPSAPPTEPLPGYRPAQSDGLLRHLHRGRQQVPRPARRARKAPAQRCLADLRAGDAPWRWASASAAAFSGCCTWRSFRSGWSASSISTL